MALDGLSEGRSLIHVSGGGGFALGWAFWLEGAILFEGLCGRWSATLLRYKVIALAASQSMHRHLMERVQGAMVV